MKHPKKSATGLRITATPATSPLIQEILVTTDLSGQSLPAVRYALALGGRVGGAVTLLHVLETASSMSGMEAVILARTDSEATTLARRKLEALAQREARGKGAMVTVVRTGRPFHEISLAAHEREVDLIVIATHGYTGLKRVWLGSTAERVVRHAPCPVLTVPTRGLPKRAAPASRFRLQSILVPIDFSNLSRDALPYALLLARQFGAELTLMHVVQISPLDRLLGAEITNHIMVPVIKQAEADLAALATEVGQSGGVRVSTVVLQGTPHASICKRAKSQSADLIVLTTHGHAGLKHVWLGSTAERVVRHASCPVLAVRELIRKTV